MVTVIRAGNLPELPVGGQMPMILTEGRGILMLLLLHAHGKALWSHSNPNSLLHFPLASWVGGVEDLDIRCERLTVRHTCVGMAVQDFVCMY